MEQGVHAVYQRPMAYYENKELTDELKKYILSKNSQGIESEVAFGLKTNLVESKFDFFNHDVDIVKSTAYWIGDCLKKTISGSNFFFIDSTVAMCIAVGILSFDD